MSYLFCLLTFSVTGVIHSSCCKNCCCKKKNGRSGGGSSGGSSDGSRVRLPGGLGVLNPRTGDLPSMTLPSGGFKKSGDKGGTEKLEDDSSKKVNDISGGGVPGVEPKDDESKKGDKGGEVVDVDDEENKLKNKEIDKLRSKLRSLDSNIKTTLSMFFTRTIEKTKFTDIIETSNDLDELTKLKDLLTPLFDDYDSQGWKQTMDKFRQYDQTFTDKPDKIYASVFLFAEIDKLYKEYNNLGEWYGYLFIAKVFATFHDFIGEYLLAKDSKKDVNYALIYNDAYSVGNPVFFSLLILCKFYDDFEKIGYIVDFFKNIGFKSKFFYWFLWTFVIHEDVFVKMPEYSTVYEKIGEIVKYINDNSNGENKIIKNLCLEFSGETKNYGDWPFYKKKIKVEGNTMTRLDYIKYCFKNNFCKIDLDI